MPKEAATVKRARKAASSGRSKRGRHPVEAAAPVVPTRTKEGRFVKGQTGSWYGRPCKPKPPVVDFFKGLTSINIASNPILAAAAKTITTTIGGKSTQVPIIEGIAMTLASIALKGHYQAARDMIKNSDRATAAALKEKRERWFRLMRIKIALTAELIRSDKGAPRSAMLLMRDPRQIMWLDTDELVTIESLELAKRIRWLTRMEPRFRLAVEELAQKYRASTDAAEREKYSMEIRSRVSRVKELEAYGLREMPNAETIVRAQAEHYMKTGQLPFD